MTEQTVTAPDLGDLLAQAPSNWGKWGPDDEVGSLNYLGPEQAIAAAALVRSGKVFTLQRLIGDPKGDPVWPGRSPAVRTQIMDEASWDGAEAPQFPGGLHYADDKIDAFLQGSTQYDALGHVWYDGKLWNGYDARTTVGGMDVASVEPIAQRGVVGRGVLLDMARFRGKEHLDTAETFDHTDLEACAAAQGVELRPRDVLLIRTNYLQLFFELGDAFYEGFCEPGLQYSPELVQWFADREIPNLVTDTIANEVTTDQNNGVALTLHCALMRNLGVVFTEITDLEALAADCAADGVYEFMYTAAPLKIAQGSGAPVNPVVVK
ncbi:cyclase family protein [Tsukamurella tyrosinosolvens]|uniref:Kynurenine formamidase n=1 Tax=Tsukamurella tyrosinosolvens TaxID=57704 RepID=A0A1H4T728_TSUTY|nr:cyclase family protein [Tsukamurella tyrosinosolvens]AUN40505.1 metal-dependent hydrolase [Tsukamurella tyrosinosolvens]KXO93274.1 metal-dependent hydrolase [Tsukamurella tyrosinosolvens]KXP05949.1 metal-dependent hydrolase [Tsukamurella tyrosinosolvens]KZL95781.1 metal-dependent hydrolase [Tsukamurella tyrosinosolvens]MCA4993416.1 cyclase family protein [Tsukamurella tyrosinosolvens]